LAAQVWFVPPFFHRPPSLLSFSSYGFYLLNLNPKLFDMKIKAGLLIASLLVAFVSAAKGTDSTKELKLWYQQPAAQWNEALPVGNGSLGGMVFGIPGKEKIVLNEQSIWSGQFKDSTISDDGYKYVRQIQQMLFDGKYAEAEKLANDKLLKGYTRAPAANQMLGYLFIDSKNVEEFSNYRRELDLNNAVARTSFTNNGVKYSREVFSSYPGKVMVIRYAADKPGKISFTSWFDRNDKTEIKTKGNSIYISEHVGNGIGVRLFSIINFEAKGGKINSSENKITVEGASEVEIRIVAATDYQGGNPEPICQARLKKAKTLPYDKLLAAHVNDYKSLFNRVDFETSANNGEDLPTDARLNKVKNGAEDPYLTELQYQLGRYLLISSSRPGSMPANLQGIWVDGFNPPWSADYHININIEMNYWLSEITNLSECHLPFLEFIKALRIPGEKTAREMYGCRGSVAHYTTDAWLETGTSGNAQWAMWPMGLAWACEHLFMHYEFTNDKKYLEDFAYPVMKDAALFFTDLMAPDPKTGKLVSGPSISPENRFYTADGQKATMNMGPTMDREIITELFTNCIKTSEILGIDLAFADTLKQKLAQMPPLEIGSDGRLKEWVEEFKEVEPGHRHISHLFALFPSNQISKEKTPELFEAAKKTIEYRLANGGGHTGWSRAWIINFYARLLEGDKAYENILALQRKSTLSNLFDNHPPFQIDGNFGVVSGITEMLMQSQTGKVEILPALPSAWPSGKISGIVARGGFEVAIEWSQGKLDRLEVKSHYGNPLTVRYNGIEKTYSTKKHEVLIFAQNLVKE
jgi:alpha-L-fucosidase 2